MVINRLRKSVLLLHFESLMMQLLILDTCCFSLSAACRVFACRFLSLLPFFEEQIDKVNRQSGLFGIEICGMSILIQAVKITVSVF